MNSFQQRAAALIEQARQARPTCEHCETATILELYDRGYRFRTVEQQDMVFTILLPKGWDLNPAGPGFVRRCPTCAVGRAFPWADRLDVERVVQMLEQDPRCKHRFHLDILEDTLCPKQQRSDS